MKKSDRGTVELIKHRASEKKFVLRSFCGNAEVCRRLLNCTCRNLPEIYEVAADGDQNLVLEEYIRGDNMGDMLKGALFTQEETRQIVRGLCSGLWGLHQAGAVHRDVKPENIILRGSDAVLIDFDAARLHKPDCGGDTQILGTTGYAAPEQYGLSQSDARSDIYALGIVINVMLTGEHPSRRLADGRFGRIVTRCTQVNPAKRYKTVLHLLDEL
ncbi:MAG: serine/threonine-protein kinase [Eubacteriales bacterium]|nr:serine/threonine-protein kinase [Eubacteriales bacterium]